MRQEDQKAQYIIIKQINTSTGPTSMMDPEPEAILVRYLASEIEPICLGGKRLINWIVHGKNVPEPPIFVGTLVHHTFTPTQSQRLSFFFWMKL